MKNFERKNRESEQEKNLQHQRELIKLRKGAFLDIKKSREIVKGMEDIYNKVEALIPIADATKREEDWIQVRKMMREIMDDDATGTIMKTRILGLLAKTTGKEADLRRLGKEIQKIEDSSWRENALETYARILTEQGNIEEAKEIAKEIKNDYVQGEVFLSIIKALLKQEHTKEAKEIAEKIKKYNPKRDKALALIAESLTEQGDIEEAQELFRDIDDNYLRAKLLLAATKVINNEILWRNIHKYIERIFSPEKRTKILIQLAKTTGKEEDWANAREAASSVKNDLEKERALVSIAETTGKEEDWMKARDFITKDVKFNYEKSQASLILTEGLVQHGKFEEARTIAESIEDRLIKVRALTSIATATKEKFYSVLRETNFDSFKIENFIKDETDAYIIGVLMREGVIPQSVINQLKEEDIYRKIISIAEKRDEEVRLQSAQEAVKEINQTSPFLVRTLARSLHFADMDSKEELWNLWNRVQVKEGSPIGSLSLRVARELAKEDINRGGSLVMNILKNPKLEYRKFRYFVQLLISEGYLTEKVHKLLSRKTFPTIKKLIEKHSSQFNTTIDTIVECQLNLENEVVIKDIFDALEGLGAITPSIFKQYREKGKQERKEFIEKIKKLQHNFFENNPVQKFMKDAGKDIFTEMIYLSYKPQNMSLNKVKELLNDVEDRTTDIVPYLKENESGMYVFDMKDIRYVLREGVQENSKLKKEITILMGIAQGEELDKDTEEMKFFSKTLKKVAKGTPDLDIEEMAILASILGRVPVSHKVLLNHPYHAYTNLLEHFTHYAKNNFQEALEDILEQDEYTREGFTTIINNPKRKNLLMKRLRIEDKKISNEELITKAILDIFEKRLVTQFKKELRKYEKVVSTSPIKKDLTAYISKNKGSFFAKSAAGICTSEDIALWSMRNHFHINIIENKNRVVGNIQAYVINDPHEKEEASLLLRGFNPTQDFLKSGISPDSFIEAVFQTAKQFAQENNFRSIYITEQGGFHALTNRMEIFQVLKKYMKNPVKKSMSIASNHSIEKIYEITKLKKSEG